MRLRAEDIRTGDVLGPWTVLTVHGTIGAFVAFTVCRTVGKGMMRAWLPARLEVDVQRRET